MNSPDHPKSVFGHREVVRRTSTPVAAPARAAGRKLPVAFTIVAAALVLVGFGISWTLPQMKVVDQRTAQAERDVTAIINRPVKPLPRTTAAGEFSPGWFHAGAIRPDFNTVDVRTSQEFPYNSYTYVASNVRPNDMFIAKDLEFNAMTKYFYVDRTLPKARLSEAEMLEVNRLYRIIGAHDLAVTLHWSKLAVLAILALLLGAALPFTLRRFR
jgi:hypothetical protein